MNERSQTPVCPPRPDDAHKGTFGTVIVVCMIFFPKGLKGMSDQLLRLIIRPKRPDVAVKPGG